MARQSKLFYVFLVVVTAVGVIVGWRISDIPNLNDAKLLNITGLFFSSLAVLALSALVSPAPRWHNFVISYLAPRLLYVQFLVPLGVVIGSAASHDRSSAALANFAIKLFLYCFLAYAFLTETVINPRLGFLKDQQSRWRFLALYLFATGVGLQLWAAILALPA